jgi:hypothetical protein
MTTKTQLEYNKLLKNDGYKVLSFPNDIDVYGNQNIMFININTVIGSRYTGNQYKVVQGNGARKPTYHQDKSGSLARKMTGQTHRIDKSIALYIPNNIQTAYGADWSTSDLGITGTIIDAATGLGDLTTVAGWKQTWDSAKAVVPNALLNTLSGITQSLTGVNVDDAKKLYTRTITNPYTEVIFNGVSNRTFSFTFKFIPKSKKEQDAIKEITDLLKFHRAPEIRYGNVNNYMFFPSEFDIMFFNKNVENKYLFKISTCAMTNMTLNQGGDSHFATHNDGAPFFTEMTLEFTELEVLTKARHLEGF